ncbi:MAG: cache domain-containing protein, partial [Lachnospiraceae bacterium]|nr:cache domain-containing protein [Lachnospiraceae bacterium]
MREKILKTMIWTTFSSLMILGIAVFCLLMFMKRGLISSSEKAGYEARVMSGEAVATQTEALLAEMSLDRAKLNDAAFSKLREAVEMAASSTALLYDHPERAGRAELTPATSEQLGEKIPMVAFADEDVASDPEVLEELSLLSNLQNELLSQNRQYEDITSDYVATESGLFLTVEEVTPAHIVPEGEHILFDARKRPWYEDAKTAGTTVFTAVFLDADSGKPSISCAAPIYSETGEFLGVSGAGMYLDSMQKGISDHQIGEAGFFCIVNQDGQVLFSGEEIGELGTSLKNGTDIRESTDPDLAELAKRAVKGEQDIVCIPMEGRQYYIAFAPMPTVGWSYLAILPEEEVTAPTDALYSMLQENTEKTLQT